MNIPVELSRILITDLGDSQLIFLKEIHGERTFPILIGMFEAQAIDNRLKGVTFPRPMTHDLLADVIQKLGGSLETIVISDLREHTFIASLMVRCGGQVVEIDARPSDAIALAAGLNTPIFVSEKVFGLVTNNGPNTRAGRLELLRERRAILAEQIELLKEMLNDKNLNATTSQADIQSYHQQLAQMETEFTAIDEILKRLK